MISDCLVKSQPFTLPHFNDSETFVLYIASSQFIEFSFPTVKFDVFISERWVGLLTGTKVVEATHCFKHSIAMRTKLINTEAVSFLLSACSLEDLNFTNRSCTLKTDITIFSQLWVLFCGGVNLLVPYSISQPV